MPAADAMAAWLEGAGGAVHVVVRQVEGAGRLIVAPRAFKQGGLWMQQKTLAACTRKRAFA